MKKIFFSAVALVAFSSVSMANTIEIDEKIILDSPKTDFCSNVAADVLCELDPYDELTPTQANAVYQIAMYICLNQVIKVG
ncbi:MAG: hypothetical protein O9282_04805 [Flavobacterium sp.]|jgi:hypothetical protein|uniref:hypothetical protein n=1 Tax=Flavobacterium sp. TaxID=239 RepID=UPI0022C7A83A|nr:hypothetical protein [Flavobacterium sp.]MCZ8330613.1 hypothetical protein [Flavobacterium sp.]